MDQQTHNVAQLWIGSEIELISRAELFLQKQFCSDNGCTYCLACQQIRQRQHHALLWITPEKNYTREQIQPILYQLSFKLAPNEKFFCILEHADFLNATCANALLKSIEEPPPGYQFILLASRPHMVLPTIQSRCMIQTIGNQKQIIEHQELFDHFTQNKILSATQFLEALEHSEITERTTITLIDNLLAHWRTQIHTAVKNNNQENIVLAQKNMHALTRALQKPPMPGSSKLFWKNLYLQLNP